MILRNARAEEAKAAYQCIEDARVYHSSFRFVQWHPGYPTLQTIKDDIEAGIGYVLDKVFDTRPYLFAVFLLFGGAAGFLNVYRMAKDEENKKGVR